MHRKIFLQPISLESRDCYPQLALIFYAAAAECMQSRGLILYQYVLKRLQFVFITNDLIKKTLIFMQSQA